jgi:hypothetical protein
MLGQIKDELGQLQVGRSTQTFKRSNFRTLERVPGARRVPPARSQRGSRLSAAAVP